MTRWNRRLASGEHIKEQLKDILDEVSQRQDWPTASVEQFIGDHCAACMNETLANEQCAAGTPMVRPAEQRCEIW